MNNASNTPTEEFIIVRQISVSDILIDKLHALITFAHRLGPSINKQSAPQLLDKTFLVELLHQAGINELLGTHASGAGISFGDIVERPLHGLH